MPKNPQIKEEFSLMYQSEKKLNLHEFSTYHNGKKVKDSVYLAFLKQIFDHRTEEYYDWCLKCVKQFWTKCEIKSEVLV